MEQVFRVLICDDSMLIRRKLNESILMCCGYAHIFQASDGLEAIYMYKLHRPNIVFMDIILPGKNGIEVVKDIKNFDPEAEIIMVSSVGTKANLFKAFAAGACDFIQKPWEQSFIDKILLRYIPKPVVEKTPVENEGTSLEQGKEAISDGNEKNLSEINEENKENSIDSVEKQL